MKEFYPHARRAVSSASVPHDAVAVVVAVDDDGSTPHGLHLDQKHLSLSKRPLAVAFVVDFVVAFLAVVAAVISTRWRIYPHLETESTLRTMTTRRHLMMAVCR